MYEISDASDERLLAEAETIDEARYAARTMHSEGEDLPILISLDGTVRERLIEGLHGAMIETSDANRLLR